MGEGVLLTGGFYNGEFKGKGLLGEFIYMYIYIYVCTSRAAARVF